MHNFFLVLILVSFIFLIIGFFNPNSSLFWYKQVRTKKKSAIIYGLTLVSSIFLLGISSPNKENAPNSNVRINSNGQNALEKYDCKIMNTEAQKPFHMTIYIQIPEQLTESQLKEIATQMKNENEVYKMLFIFYLLPNMEIGTYPWASTNYSPNLKIIINGVDKTTEEKLKNLDLPVGEIIGKWYDKSPLVENVVIIFKIDGKFKMKKSYRDGSNRILDLQLTKIDGKSKFVYKNKFGEYLLIEKDGRLGQYDEENGFLSKVDKIE